MSGQIEYIRTFLAVASQGGFSPAARHLGVSATIVTRHIAELESLLGVQLFTRTTRKVDLTEAGRAYQARVAAVVRELESADDDVRARQVGLFGPLRISAPMSFGTRFLPDIIAQFRILHPAVHLQVVLSDRFVDIAGEGFDLALRISEAPQDQTVLWRKICQVERVIVGAPSYFSVRGTPATPEELGPLDCLHYATAPGPAAWMLRQGEQVRRVPLRPCFTSNNGDLLATLAATGQGLALLPRFLVQEMIDAGRLVPVLQDWTAPDIWLSTAMAPYEVLPAKLSAFVSFVEAYALSSFSDRFLQGSPAAG